MGSMKTPTVCVVADMIRNKISEPLGRGEEKGRKVAGERDGKKSQCVLEIQANGGWTAANYRLLVQEVDVL